MYLLLCSANKQTTGDVGVVSLELLVYWCFQLRVQFNVLCAESAVYIGCASEI